MLAIDAINHIFSKYKLDSGGLSKYPISIPDTREAGLLGVLQDFAAKIGVEIGVEEGLFSEKLCQALPEADIYGIDPWISYLRGRRGYSGRRLSRYYKEAAKRLQPYNNYHIIKKYSIDAVADFADNSLDFVYIDGDHAFDYVMLDIIMWSRKVKIGGIVSGHDYRASLPNTPIDVIAAVDVYTKAHKISPWFIFDKYSRKHDAPSWFWIRS